MLPKDQRLTRSFEIIFRKGAKITAPFFVLRAVPAWDTIPRLAVTVSKKTDKTAVGRNRIRRRLIEAVKKAGFPKSIDTPYRIVLIGRNTVKTAIFQEIVQEVVTSFKKLEKWRFQDVSRKKIP